MTTTVESREVGMATPHTDVEKMIQELNQHILPSTLMECFDAYREEKHKEAIKAVPEATLTWFLDMLNRYRGPEHKNESLLEVFDPSMYTESHPAWHSPPGTVIELPALMSEVVALAEEDRSRHLALCTGCQKRLETWTKSSVTSTTR